VTLPTRLWSLYRGIHDIHIDTNLSCGYTYRADGVFGPGKHRERLSEYLSILMSWHFYLAALISLVLLVISLGVAVAGLSTLSMTLLSLVLASLFILLLFLMRRACYARLKPSLAASGGVVYLVLMLVGIFTLYRLGALSAASGFGVMGFSSLVASIWLAVTLRMKPSLVKSAELTREAFKDHWRYGRWAVAGQMIAWAPGNIYFLLLPIWGGLGASASLKAMMNLIVPIQHTNAALSVLLLPALSRVRGTPRFDTLLRFALMFFVFGSLVYWLLVGLFHEPLLNLLYGGKFRYEDGLLWLLGLLPISVGVEVVLGVALRVFERPDQVFWAYVWSTAVAVTLACVLTQRAVDRPRRWTRATDGSTMERHGLFGPIPRLPADLPELALPMLRAPSRCPLRANGCSA
jgi:O-antigen/teichoic acid export membrane protein